MFHRNINSFAPVVHKFRQCFVTRECNWYSKHSWHAQLQKQWTQLWLSIVLQVDGGSIPSTITFLSPGCARGQRSVSRQGRPSERKLLWNVAYKWACSPRMNSRERVQNPALLNASCLSACLQLRAYLGDVAGLAPHHCSKANSAIVSHTNI